jgi:hypothetical protein
MWHAVTCGHACVMECTPTRHLAPFFCDRESCQLLCVSEVEREQMESERESRSLPWPAERADTLQRDCHSVGNSTAFGALVWG